MTVAPTPQPYDPERYRTASAHYEQGRVPYAPALIRRVAEVTGLGPRHRVLDLGCGPGPLARRFAAIAGEVVAMDPTPEMLSLARALAGESANIRFVAGSSYDLGPALGRFHLVVMGRSFHWMDRVDTLKRLDRIVEPAGAVALFGDTAPAIPANGWRKVWHDICERYEPNTGAHQGADWIRHEAVLLDSAFPRMERFSVIERRALDVETLVQRTLSMGSTSPSYLGEKKTAAITAEIRAKLADVREEVVETFALVAWR
jgi:ubiquinone/menaquinone biosynthesis C-methylase UbiE